MGFLWDDTLPSGNFWEFHLADTPAVGIPRMHGQGETVAKSLAPFLDLYSPGLVGSSL